MRRSVARHALVAMALAALGPPALAHVEQAQAAGLLSGLAHPVSGLDHVLAMVAVGLWGAQLGAPAIWLLPLTFPIVMALGGLLGLLGIALPGRQACARHAPGGPAAPREAQDRRGPGRGGQPAAQRSARAQARRDPSGTGNLMSDVVIYADGACRGNPGPGGWGAWLKSGAHEKEIFGGEKLTTNNRMELTAVIQALATLQKRCSVTVYTDSSYVKDGITKWIHGWKARGWTTADKKPVKNVELWQRLDELNAAHSVQWRWVKGHAGDPGNERADRLANRGVDSVLG